MPVSCPKFDKPSHNGYISGLKINKIILKFLKNIKLHRGVEQLVARRAHNPKVVGSSPAPATNKKNPHHFGGDFFYREIKRL